MKRTLSLILAALLLASSMTACGDGTAKETEKTETKSVETNAPATTAPATEAPATDPVETEAPAPVYSYDTSLITENGGAKAHIVLPEGASADEQTAVNELVLHIKKVSGADIAVVNTPAEDSLPIVIATPASMPELEELFPEDLAWLRTLEEKNDIGTKRYGPDGFSVRQKNGKIYIFGATAEGALNGTYDFIEENLGVIWVNSSDSGIVFDEMPTLTAVKADYREKSPFAMRYGFSSQLLDQRNKHDTAARIAGSCHNIKWLLTTSPSYDPNEMEYWETFQDGIANTGGNQVNYWSELTASVVADSVLAKLDAYSDADRPKYYPVNMEDYGFSTGVFPDQTLPFEYAPGQFVDPEDPTYTSTVYFTFINRVARKVAEKYPDVNINTLAYNFSSAAPICELEENVSIWFCPWVVDYSDDSSAETLVQNVTGDYDFSAIQYVKIYENWLTTHPDTGIVLFDYYYCHFVGGWYERPFWYRVQNDFIHYAETGGLGMYSCGSYVDNNHSIYDWQKAVQYGNPADFEYEFTHAEAHAMNLLSQWLFYKLTWNPYEDVESLIEYFCDKVYGEASEHMQEYYRLLRMGWRNSDPLRAEVFNSGMTLFRASDYYFDYFIDVEVDGIHIYSAIQEALTKAWEAADDRAKEFIRRPYEVFEDWERFLE